MQLLLLRRVSRSNQLLVCLCAAARLEARLAELQATAVPPVKPDGCDALTVDGALRPCDAPDPGE